jgi:hypothetical protein
MSAEQILDLIINYAYSRKEEYKIREQVCNLLAILPVA